MLYLAEVQKSKGGFIGSGKAALKLLACQRSDQSWSSVDEVLPAEEANNFNAGVLVMIDLANNRQIKRVQEASRQLVSILQTFSRQLEKSKNQEEEIEQWKQSLTYQSQELNRREMEMEARREQLQQLESDSERLEEQRQELENLRTAAESLQDEVKRNQEELQGAWDQLKGEQRRLEERQSEIQQGAVLDEEQARKIQELLDRLASAVAPTEAVREQLNLSFDTLNTQQVGIDEHWQKLEQHRGSAQQLQEEVERQGEDIQNRWHEWQQAQSSLEQSRLELKAQQITLENKQEYLQVFGLQLQHQEELYQQISALAYGADEEQISEKVDIAALEEMPLEELQSVVNDLQKELEKLSRFVNDQEEELGMQRQVIEELQQKIQQASEYDRLNLETELTDEQDGYRMLDETLVGQRRNLREREEILKQHEAVLHRRQGISGDGNRSNKIDLTPLLTQVDLQRQKQSEELKQLESQAEQLKEAIQQAEALIDQQATEQDSKQIELKQLDGELQKQHSSVSDLWGKVNVCEAILQPIQDGISNLRQKLDTIANVLAQFQEASDYQLQAIAEMKQMLGSLISGAGGQSDAA